MPSKPKFDPDIHDENPEWTKADFARARPASELPPTLLAQFKGKRGRPKSLDPKEAIKIRLDSAVLKALRAGGAGWQTAINDLLKSAIRDGKISFRETAVKLSKSGAPVKRVMRNPDKASTTSGRPKVKPASKIARSRVKKSA